MTTEEKAAAFDLLCEALINRWHNGTHSAYCAFLVNQPSRATAEACVPDLIEWAERYAKTKARMQAARDANSSGGVACESS